MTNRLYSPALGMASGLVHGTGDGFDLNCVLGGNWGTLDNGKGPFHGTALLHHHQPQFERSMQTKVERKLPKALVSILLEQYLGSVVFFALCNQSPKASIIAPRLLHTY